MHPKPHARREGYGADAAGGGFFVRSAGMKTEKRSCSSPPHLVLEERFEMGGGKNEEGIDSMVAIESGRNCYFRKSEVMQTN